MNPVAYPLLQITDGDRSSVWTAQYQSSMVGYFRQPTRYGWSIAASPASGANTASDISIQLPQVQRYRSKPPGSKEILGQILKSGSDSQGLTAAQPPSPHHEEPAPSRRRQPGWSAGGAPGAEVVRMPVMAVVVVSQDVDVPGRQRSSR